MNSFAVILLAILIGGGLAATPACSTTPAAKTAQNVPKVSPECKDTAKLAPAQHADCFAPFIKKVILLILMPSADSSSGPIQMAVIIGYQGQITVLNRADLLDQMDWLQILFNNLNAAGRVEAHFFILNEGTKT